MRPPRVTGRTGMRQPRAATPPSAPRVPAQAPFTPAWAIGHVYGPQMSTASVEGWVELLQRGNLRLPRFQRAFVWTDDQIVTVFDSLIKGYHVGSLLLWERHDCPASVERFGGVDFEAPAGSGRLVIDGQQRLGAIASAILSGRWWFDLRAGSIDTNGDGAWRIPMGYLGDMTTGDFFRWMDDHLAEHQMDEDELRDSFAAACKATAQRSVSAVVLDAQMTQAQVLESFRRLNTEGTRMPLDELDAAVARFEQERIG